jgi:CO/xanthine dehydrogenase Mo-binding subunit
MCGALHPIYATEAPQSAVQVCADRSGRVAILSGTADIGQGSNHMLAAIVAERLGIPATDCVVVEADTGITPVDLGSYSSRVTFMAGNAALQAADRLRDAIDGALGGGCTFREGRIHFGDKSVSFSEGVEQAEAVAGTLAFVGHYTPPKIGSRFRRQSVGPSPAYSFTAQVAEVEVDRETGVVTVLKVWCAHDCGRAINRQAVLGQIEGSVYMGVGEAMAEEQSYRNGLHRAPSILEYKIPTVHDTPEIEAIVIESNDPEGPFGAKEAGEGPQLATAPAIANAIHDAIGAWPGQAPFTPERILRLLERSARG